MSSFSHTAASFCAAFSAAASASWARRSLAVMLQGPLLLRRLDGVRPPLPAHKPVVCTQTQYSVECGVFESVLQAQPTCPHRIPVPGANTGTIAVLGAGSALVTAGGLQGGEGSTGSAADGSSLPNEHRGDMCQVQRRLH